jgi:hypothetical protein
VLALAIAACADRKTAECRDGEHMLAADRCNECECGDGGWGWTDKGCFMALPSDGSARCYSLGIADVSDAPGVQLACTVESVEPAAPGSVLKTNLPQCSETTEGPDWPSADATRCWFALVDDAVSTACVESQGERVVAEIGVLRRPSDVVAGVELSVVCAPPEPMCPAPSGGSE